MRSAMLQAQESDFTRIDARSETLIGAAPPVEGGPPPQRPSETVDGRYVLLTELGHGGMGQVMLAEDRRLRRRVAVKLLRPTNKPDIHERFRREAQLLASL